MTTMHIDEVRVIVGNIIQPLTPEHLAELFANLCSADQARFFNHVSVVVSEWACGLPMQLEYVCNEHSLNADGRAVMRLIGEYSDASMNSNERKEALMKDLDQTIEALKS
jgi:hypothetical protein